MQEYAVSVRVTQFVCKRLQPQYSICPPAFLLTHHKQIADMLMDRIPSQSLNCPDLLPYCFWLPLNGFQCKTHKRRHTTELLCTASYRSLYSVRRSWIKSLWIRADKTIQHFIPTVCELLQLAVCVSVCICALLPEFHGVLMMAYCEVRTLLQ